MYAANKIETLYPTRGRVEKTQNTIRMSFRSHKVRQLQSIILCLTVAMFCQFAYATTQVSQFGITWTFDKDYTVGQFANGDYWVVGPVNITDINPAWDGTKNGAMVNPALGYNQGYHTQATWYNSTLNVADDILSNPLELQPNDSLVSTIGLNTKGPSGLGRTWLSTAAVLTVLDAPVSNTTFRPPYPGNDKPLFDSTALRRDLLLNLTLTGGSFYMGGYYRDPAPEGGESATHRLARYYQRPHIFHKFDADAEDIRPYNNADTYYRGAHLRDSEAALLLLGDVLAAEKEELLINYVQVGIDAYYTLQTNPNPPARAERCLSKWVIVFAGIMLDNEDLKSNHNFNHPTYGHSYFKTDATTYFGDATKQLWTGWQDSGHPYAANVMWRLLKAGNPDDVEYEDDPSYTISTPPLGRDERYRRSSHSYTWVGQALAARLMNATEIYNHDPFFAYIDRWMHEDDSAWYTVPPYPDVDRPQMIAHDSGFSHNMWVTYRPTLDAPSNPTITATAGDGGQISPSGTTEVVPGGSQTYTITPNAGYHISDVLVDGSSVGAVTSYTFTNVTANHTIAATFAINTYTITASAGTGGQISPSGTTEVVSGGSQTYTITPNAGYHISAVLVDGSSVGAVASYTFTNVTADHTITATFALTSTYTITASAGTGGQISPSGTTPVVSGGSQTYTITANAGYHISDVLVDDSSVGAVTSYTFTNVTANHTITATFAIDTYTITASAGTGGQISPSGTTEVVSGSSQTYTITANAGYHISDVLVDGSSVGAVTSYTFTNVTANHTIAATFAINTYTITASAGNGGQISPSGTTQVNEGATQTYTITPNAGYHISDVLVDGSSVGAVSSYSFTNVTADHTIAATFAIDEEDVTAPTVNNLSPQADSIQAPLNTLVILDITDSGDGVDANSVTVKVNNNIVYSGNTAKYSSTHGECHRIGTKADYTFIYQSEQNFDFDQPVSVTVNATDLKSNIMGEYSYSFRTEMRSFGKNKNVGLDNPSKGRPVTVGDSNGNIWAAWHAGVTGSRDIYIGKLAAEAKFFGDGIKLTDNSADQCNPVIAVGSDDKLYVAWQDNRRGDWDIYVSTSDNGINWSAEQTAADSNDNQINPAIVVDSSLPTNNAYIVWEDDPNGNQDIYVATSNNGFVTKTVSQITFDTSDQVEPAIAADSDNTIYVVWTDTRNSGKNDIYGAASNNGPWTNIRVVTQIDGQSSPAIATEAVGPILHLVWVDDRTIAEDDDIFYAKTSGGLPGSPLTGSSIIDDNTGADQISPVIITTGHTGNGLKVFACWRDERNADADLYSAELSSGSGTNVFVGDDGTNTDQSEPAIGIDGYGHPYLVWTNEKTDISYAGSTFIEPDALASTNISISSRTTVGTPWNAIQSLDDVSAELPQGAYLCDVQVTISRIRNPQKLPSNNRTFLYEFGPSGTTFSEPVTITIPYNATTLVSSPSAYWYNPLTGLYSQEGITNVQVIQISSGLYALRFKTTHFSGFGGGGPFGGFGGGGGGGGCSMSPNSQDSIVGLLLPYIGLAVAMVILKLQDRRKRKVHNITKS